MKRGLIAILAALAIGIPGSIVLGQAVVQFGLSAIDEDGDPFGDQMSSESSGQDGATPAAAGATPAQSTETERHKRLKALTYDRRPSAILKAWSEPPGKEVEAKKDEADAKAADEKKKEEPKKEADKPANENAGDAKPATGAAKETTPDATKSAADEAVKKDDAQPAGPVTPEEQEKAKKAEADAKAAKEKTKQEEEQKKKEAEAKALEKELKELQRHVTLGKWSEAKAYFAGIPAAEGKDGYAQMLRSLAAPPQNAGQPRQQFNAPGIGNVAEQQQCNLDDVLGLASACPHERNKETIGLLANLLRQTLQSGAVAADVVVRLQKESTQPVETLILSPRQCAQLLAGAGQSAEVEPFLPTLEKAVEEKDAEAINLLARMRIAQHGKDRKPELLDQAWKTIQASLALVDGDAKQQEEALKLAVELAPKVREDLGQAWLDQSFTQEPQRGMNILTAIGNATSTGIQSQPHLPDSRLKALELQKTAVEALLKSSPERAREWRATLALLAHSWQREADFSRVASQSSMYGPRMQRDNFGNIFYMNDDDSGMMMQRQQGNQARPIGTSQVLEAAPSEAWLAEVDALAQPRFYALYAQLYLKVAEEERAYPYIERVAASHPELARELAQEFIRVWTKNHDPNASRRYSNPYMFMWGFERKAESIPLTRSKQERNLVELAGWVKRLRTLPIKDLDETLLTTAFTTCHSSAEVYRTEAIEKVFGAADALSSKTLAQLAQQMRQNLAALWRSPAEQEAKKTKRKKKDIEAEVLRGYGVASQVVADGLKRTPDDWRLVLAQACIAHDEIAYRQETAPTSEFSHDRLSALADFQKAAELYAKDVPSLREEDQTTDVYEHWFYAGLGGSDLAQIDHRSTPDDRQPPLIRQAMASLPGDTAKFHQDRFANLLFTRMSSLKPTVKFRYLKAGFEIVGDHKQAREARQLYDYYQDLVKEIRLETRLDGPAMVGHDEPFGVFVELYHTPEIERESGGFGRYLQNQNGNIFFSYNYGRPTENYRDKFKEAVTAVLEDNFDVVSVTFQADDVNSRASNEPGWRVTPYAYLLLKSHGPQVDKLPTLKMDLDFLDTSGFVVLPIQSAALPIDSAPEKSTRPYDTLAITQTLDERRAQEGKLILEVKATAHGLVPPLAEMLNVKIDGFEVGNVEDDGVSVSRFDPESSESVVISERLCTVSLVGRTDLTERPKTFTFPQARDEHAEMTYQRYDDADLATVEQEISLEKQYGGVRRPWLWGLAIAAPVGLIGWAGYRAASKRRRQPVVARFPVPATITPFSVLALLRNIQNNNGLAPAASQELTASINSLERHYFADESLPTPDLRSLAETWSARAR
ncbi:MAG TPA: hypothetical protein VGN12_20570 [Pirellulales bacterium]|jgi:hypothetical protein